MYRERLKKNRLRKKENFLVGPDQREINEQAIRKFEQKKERAGRGKEKIGHKTERMQITAAQLKDWKKRMIEVMSEAIAVRV